MLAAEKISENANGVTRGKGEECVRWAREPRVRSRCRCGVRPVFSAIPRCSLQLSGFSNQLPARAALIQDRGTAR